MAEKNLDSNKKYRQILKDASPKSSKYDDLSPIASPDSNNSKYHVNSDGFTPIDSSALKNQEKEKQFPSHLGESKPSFLKFLAKAVVHAAAAPFALSAAIFTGAIYGILFFADATTTEVKKRFGVPEKEINNSGIDFAFGIVKKVFNTAVDYALFKPMTVPIEDINKATKGNKGSLAKGANPEGPLSINLGLFENDNSKHEYDPNATPKHSALKGGSIPGTTPKNVAYKSFLPAQGKQK